MITPSLTTRELDICNDPALLDPVMQLRLAVWAPQVPFPLTLDDVADEFEQPARHWAIFDGDRIVAAARLSIHQNIADVPEAVCLAGVFADAPPAPIGFLSRLVVASDYRRRGLGRRLDSIRIRAATQAGCKSVLVLVFDVSGESRCTQLTSLGFRVVGQGQRDTHPQFSQLAAPLVLLYGLDESL